MAQTSKGLIGLPHFDNSRISSELWEPIYNNLFTVQMTLPEALALDTETTNLVLEEVTKVDGLDTNKNPGAVDSQTYKYANRSFAKGKPDNTYIDIKLDFNINLMYPDDGGAPSNIILKTLRKWSDLIYDPLTGRTGLKRHYTGGPIIITAQDREGTPFWQWTAYHVFPITSITPPSWDYTNGDLYKVTGWTLRCDTWREVQL